MTWRPAVETDLANGRKRDVFEVHCDAPGCLATEVVGQHGGNNLTVQKLLLKRRWTYTSVVDGAKDLCPAHADKAVA